jgi:hypothetical protein
MGTTQRDRGTTHPSPDDGEDAVDRRRSFDSGTSLTRERRRARESLKVRGGGAGVTGGPWGFIYGPGERRRGRNDR